VPVRPYDAIHVDDIPPLAWLLNVPRGSGTPQLVHGRHVELFDRGFFEGAWDGDFGDAAFDRVTNAFGSGAVVEGVRITVVPPVHTFEAVYIFTGKATTAISNSLVYLCAFHDLVLDPIDWRSGERFARVTQGLRHLATELRVKSGSIKVVHHHNIVCDGGQVSTLVPKPPPPRFDDFASYYGYLTQTLRSVDANANDGRRVHRYVALATLSSGYDSAAAATLAATVLGCREAVSLKRSFSGDPDSGSEVAQVLGITLHEFDRAEHVPHDDASVAEFLAGGSQGEDYIYRAFDPVLSGRMLLTGFLGDAMWDKKRPPCDDLHRKDLSGSSLGEFRVARDFIHVMVPFIGAVRHPDIYRISNSSELAPYSVGGSYDRPVPRRIVESAGVPRAVFGQKKRATSLVFYRRPALISEQTRAEIEAFERDLRLGWWARTVAAVVGMRWKVGLKLFHQLLRWTPSARAPSLRSRVLARVRRIGLFVLSRVFGPYEVFEHGYPPTAIWQRWAIERLAPRYAASRELRSGRPSVDA
jgi:hypothetical protein